MRCWWHKSNTSPAGQACWRKNISNAQLSGISKDLHAQDYTFLGDGNCRGPNNYYLFFADSYELSTHDLCRKACSKDIECIGYTYASSATRCEKLYAHKHTTNYDVLFRNSDANWQVDYDITRADGKFVHGNTLCYRKSVQEPLSCLPCARGTAQADTGQASCDNCAVVGFQNDTRQYVCTECEHNRSSYYAYSVDATDCVCTAVFSTSATGECMPCAPRHYSPKAEHEYELLTNGFCKPATGMHVNARVIYDVPDAFCRGACSAWSTCTGYQVNGTGDKLWCQVFGDFVDIGLPEFRMTNAHIPGQWYGQPYWNS